MNTDPVAAVEAAIEADRAFADPALWISRVPDEALRARASELAEEGARGRALWGVPVAVKDNIDVLGLPTTAACPDFSYAPRISAPAVQHMIDAGAIVMGKTNLDQFATGLVGVRSPYGTPRNVFDPARVPGGSSSGSAVAVAAGIVPLALGTDTAGSGRIPAMFGGIFGLKPTVGSVSARGMVPACRSIDTISVFSRTLDAGMNTLRVIVGFDAEDPYSRAAPFSHLRRQAPPPGVCLAVADVAGLCAPGVAEAYHRAAQIFPSETIDFGPFQEVARLLYDGPWVAERTAALREIVERRPDGLHPATRSILGSGLSRLTVDAFDAFHVLARARRVASQLFQKFDALLLPTAPDCPTLAELAGDPIGPNSRLGAFTNFVNLCDLAAIAVPMGFGPDRLPVGVTVIGPAWSEGRLAAIADVLQGRSAFVVDGPGPGETELFCIGAHMSGLALSHELVALGGRFLRVARTRDSYRLFALGSRPGLLRVAAGEAITGEIWALPTGAIGVFLEKIPPPLGFGTVELEGGPCLGFLAEAEGVRDAEDITRHGGWRAYLAHAGDKPEKYA